MKPFSLLVKPTSADCNLRCRYCFYLEKSELYHQTNTHRMSDDVLEAMIRSFLATDQPSYAFGWQGGEPTLMGLEFFQKITEFQKHYGKPGAQVANGVQTNGTLITDAMARHFGQYNFLLGVSVDGPSSIHDAYRITAAGGGSHDMVMRGIDNLRKHNVEHNILVLVNNINVQRPAETYHYLLDNGHLFQQYIPCVEFDRKTREPMPFSIDAQSWGRFMCGIFDEWVKSDTRRVSIRHFDSILTYLVDGVYNVCAMGVDCRQYFVVEHNGDVYPCDFFVQPELKLGNVKTSQWKAMQQSELYAEFGARKRHWQPACNDCKYLRLCNGDCPKNAPLPEGRPRDLSWLCEGWKMFYDHALPTFQRLADEIRRERAAAAAEQARHMQRVRMQQAGGHVGRNDPCPCGSGKKFKKCCGR